MNLPTCTTPSRHNGNACTDTTRLRPLGRWQSLQFLFLCASLPALCGAGIAFGQSVTENHSDAIAESVVEPIGLGEAGRLDSLVRALLDCRIGRAVLEVERTSFWRRLLPEVRFGAGYSWGALLFLEENQPVFWPRESYHLSVSISLGRILDADTHEEALLDLRRARLEAKILAERQANLRKRGFGTVSTLRDRLLVLEEERRIRKQSLEYSHLLFRQGKLEFGTLCRERLGLLALQERLLELRSEIHRVEASLGAVSSPPDSSQRLK